MPEDVCDQNCNGCMCPGDPCTMCCAKKGKVDMFVGAASAAVFSGPIAYAPTPAVHLRLEREMHPKLGDKTVYVSGKFDGLQKDEVAAYLVAQGAQYLSSVAAAGAYRRGPEGRQAGRHGQADLHARRAGQAAGGLRRAADRRSGGPPRARFQGRKLARSTWPTAGPRAMR